MQVFRSLAALSVFFLVALTDFREFREVPVDPAPGAALTRTVEVTLKEFSRLRADNLALSVIDHRL